MLELNIEQFSSIRSLFSGMEQFVIPQAVLAGHNPGRVFVDNSLNPTVAFLWTPCGYFYLSGIPGSHASLEDLHDLICNVLVPPMKQRGENGFLLIPSDTAWAEDWEVILKGRRPVEIFRRTHRFDLALFTASRGTLKPIPPEMTLQRIHAGWIRKLPHLSAEIALTWGSVEAFEAYGSGYCLLKGETLVSACLAVFASENADEISVFTDENYRRQGWGAVVTAAFIEDCLDRGRQPNWECFWDNAPSTGLAKKLGFIPLRDIPVYYWEEA